MYNFYIFSFAYVAVSIIYLIFILLIIIGLILIIRFNRKRRDNLYIIRILYWILVSASVLVTLAVIISPFSDSEGWIFFLEFITIIYGLPSIVLISKINPSVDFRSISKNQTIKKNIIYICIILLVYAGLFSSIFLFWKRFLLIPYGSSEGMAYFLFLALIRFNLVSFIPFCGIIHFVIKDSKIIKHKFSNYNLQVLLPVLIFTLSGIISAIISLVSLYLNGTRLESLIGNFLITYVFSIGSITTLFLLYLVEKHMLNIISFTSSINNQK